MKIIYGEKDKGVSPVIATILMVAITVVLAATVYLMVSGYMTGPSHPPLAASLTPMET
ncbi:MAG: archaellin/type IV pilin N-terminal domain-containing protein, partial [Thermoplasmata archaeon]